MVETTEVQIKPLKTCDPQNWDIDYRVVCICRQTSILFPSLVWYKFFEFGGLREHSY